MTSNYNTNSRRDDGSVDDAKAPAFIFALRHLIKKPTSKLCVTSKQHRLSIGGAVEFFGDGMSSTIRMASYSRKASYASAVLLSLFILAILCPIYLVPDVSEAATKDANPATLTYNATSSAASVSLTVSDNAGVFASSGSDELASFGISTNNATGYTLNLKTSGNTTSLSDGTNNIATISAVTTSSNFSNNTWGLLPSKYNGTANTTNYYPASTTGFKMDETSTANTTANTYTVGLGIKVNHNTPAGTYTNTAVVAEYVANAVTYAIHYYDNAGSEATITGMPGINPQTGTVAQGTTSTSVNLASAPTRTGYTFSGWCLGDSASVSNITTTNGVDSCSSTVYTAGQSFGIDATVSPDTYYLFAMWTGNEYTATIYYKGASSVTSSTATKCRISSLAGTSCDATIDSTVRSSTGTYSNAWAGIATAVNSMTPVNSGNNITLSSSSTYYAFYRANVTNYYYTGSAYNNRTLYRNQTLSSTSAMGTTYLSTTSTGLSNYSTAGGPNSSTWYGLSTALSNTTRTYSSVAAAAASTSTTLNSIYQFTQNFSSTGSTGVSGIGSTARYCYVSSTGNTAGGTSCTVTTPTISVNTGYTSLGWGTQGHTAQGTAASTSYTVSTSGGTLYANAKINTYLLTIIFAGSGVSSVKVCKTSGNCSGTNLMGTISSSGGSVSNLVYNTAYYLYPTYTSGYDLSSWAKTSGYGTLSSTNDDNPTFTIGAGNGTVTITGKTKTYMQDIVLADCSSDGMKVYDRRDGNDYTVKLINGKCWMTQNLRFTGTSVLSATSNVTSNKTLTYYSSDATDSSYSNHCDSTNGYNNACIKDSGSTSTGVWYNYYAATAGTISSSSNSNAASQDICPKGWHLPSGSNTTEGTDIYSLVGNTTSGYQDPTAGLIAFSAVTGGYYNPSGSLINVGKGAYWSANASLISSRWFLEYHSTTQKFRGDSNIDRASSLSVRCVRSS